MKLLKYIFIVLFFSSCNKKEESEYPRLIVPKVKKTIRVNSKEMLRIWTDYPLAINFDKDTILKKEVDFKSLEKHCVGFKDIDTILPRYNFKIILDTTYLISLKGFNYQNLSLPDEKDLIINGKIGNKMPNESQINELSKIIIRNINKEFTQEKDYVTCYPLLIYNNSSKPAYFKWIKMIQEAKDVDGKWKPIEFFQKTPTCVVTNSFFKCYSKQYQAFVVMKYNGDFKTKLRVKVKINNEIFYSNEFYGQINRSQFNKDYTLRYLRIMTSFREEKYFQDYMKFVFLE
jgi:hypothetical protein